MTEDYNTVKMCAADERQEQTTKAVQVTVFLIVFLLGVIGNVLVIATFAQYRRLRLRCMTDVFLFYLGLSDLLLLLTLPLQTGEIIIGSWTFGDGLCKINRGMYAINTYGGLLLLACISIDRYLLVVWAKAAQALRPSMLLYSKLSALAVALTSVFLSLPELISASVDHLRCENIGSEGKTYLIKTWARVAKIMGFCVAFVAMLVCYSTIGYVLMQGRGKCWRRQRTLRLIAALVVLFLLFQLPYTVVLSLRLLMDTDSVTCDQWVKIHVAEDVTLSLAYVRCCLNPLLYALVGIRFRNDVMRLLHDAGCMCACLGHLTPAPDNGSSVTPSSPAPTVLMPDVYAPPRTSAAKEPSLSKKFIF
ncbi:C-C chemokine receptor type 10 [Trichomycterus rosablanca]|uniref:C-C chemokine receptor type 10 n=1 Tax=Trichomycterus rosablanca TaxID=2290929 RepID=UPI002F34F99D